MRLTRCSLEEWGRIVVERIKGLYPRACPTDAMLTLFFERRLKWYHAHTIGAAVTNFAEDSPDSARGLLLAVERYCRERTRDCADDDTDSYGFTSRERTNTIKHVRGSDPDRVSGWSDEDVFDAWRRQEGYLNEQEKFDQLEAFRERGHKVIQATRLAAVTVG